MKTLDQLTLEDLLTEFAQMEDWEERCDALIDLGCELPDLAPEERVAENIVHGCQSQVWLVPSTEPSVAGPRLRFRANSDSMIVSGLIAVLWLIYDGRSLRDVATLDPRETFRRLELDKHLSSSRRNGLGGMVQRIRRYAEEATSA